MSSIWKGVRQNLGTKVIAVVIACVLWAIVIGSQSIEVTKEVAIDVRTATDAVTSNEIPERVSFRMQGPKAFLRAVLDRREDPILINLTSARPGLVTYRFSPDNIAVPIGVKVLGVQPAAVLIKIEALKAKELPVRLEMRGALPPGVRLVRAEVLPGRVVVKGPESRIENMAELLAAPVDLSEVRESGTRELLLDLERQRLEIVGLAPKARIEVASVPKGKGDREEVFRLKAVPVTVTPKGLGTVAEGAVQVWVSGPKELIAKLNEGNVQVSVSASGRPTGTITVVPNVLLPSGVRLVKTVPAKVTLKIH